MASDFFSTGVPTHGVHPRSADAMNPSPAEIAAAEEHARRNPNAKTLFVTHDHVQEPWPVKRLKKVVLLIMEATLTSGEVTDDEAVWVKKADEKGNPLAVVRGIAIKKRDDLDALRHAEARDGFAVGRTK